MGVCIEGVYGDDEGSLNVGGPSARSSSPSEQLARLVMAATASAPHDTARTDAALDEVAARKREANEEAVWEVGIGGNVDAGLGEQRRR